MKLNNKRENLLHTSAIDMTTTTSDAKRRRKGVGRRKRPVTPKFGLGHVDMIKNPRSTVEAIIQSSPDKERGLSGLSDKTSKMLLKFGISTSGGMSRIREAEDDERRLSKFPGERGLGQVKGIWCPVMQSWSRHCTGSGGVCDVSATFHF